MIRAPSFANPSRYVVSPRSASPRRQHDAGPTAFDVEAQKTDFTPNVDSYRLRTGPASSEVRERLRLGNDEELVSRSRRYLADEQQDETAVAWRERRSVDSPRRRERSWPGCASGASPAREATTSPSLEGPRSRRAREGGHPQRREGHSVLGAALEGRRGRHR